MIAALAPARAAMRAGRRAASGLFTALAAIGDGRMRPPATRREAAERLAAVARQLCDIHDITAEVRGQLPDGPCALVANHTSYLDALVLAQLTPCAAIAKGEVADWPVIGNGGRALGVIYVDRASPASGASALRQALAAFDAGASVLNFPEGTTTDGARVLPFKRGIFGAARIARVPIVPIALRWEPPELAWTGGAAFVPHYARTAARLSVHARVDIGRVIHTHPRDSASILAAVARQDIAAILYGGTARSRTHDASRSRDPVAAAHVALEPAERVRVPAPRPDAVLPAPGRRLRSV